MLGFFKDFSVIVQNGGGGGGIQTRGMLRAIKLGQVMTLKASEKARKPELSPLLACVMLEVCHAPL